MGGRSEHKRGGGGSDMDDNREPRRFEEDRQMRQRGQVRSRFFGQQDGVGGDGNFRSGHKLKSILLAFSFFLVSHLRR